MIEIYEKRGASVRVERSGRSTSTIVTREHGRAVRERGRFRADSVGTRPLPLAPDVAGATEIARRLGTLEQGAVTIERMTVATGVAEHNITCGDETRSWNEEVARLHLSFLDHARALRVTLDLGADRAQALPIQIAVDLAAALQTPAVEGVLLPGPVELASPVSAALWTFVARHPGLIQGSRLRLSQSTHPSWPLDGTGRRIERHAIDDATPSASFRPSFRIAPVPAWLHVRASLRGVGRLRRQAGVCILALLSPFRLTRTSIGAGVLAVSQTGAFAATLDLPRDAFADSFVRIARGATWFPFDAGAWGSTVLLDGASLTPWGDRPPAIR